MIRVLTERKYSMNTDGKVTTWNDKKGFGFISPIGGGKQVFVHIKAFSNRNRRPEINQIVTYTLSADSRGRPCAINAKLAGGQLSQSRKANNGSGAIIIAFVFLGIVGVSVLLSRIPSLIFAIYMGASLVTFIVYAMDKSAANRGAWRTRESYLHLLSLAGGWPGALVAQQMLRHKTKKLSFRFVFWITVFLNCGAFAWLFTPTDGVHLQLLMKHLPPWLTI